MQNERMQPMKQLMIAALAVLLLSFSAQAAIAWSDGPRTWYYINNGDGTVALFNTSSAAALNPKPTGHFVIPPMIDGKKLTRISTAAFKDCTGLTSVIIPDDVYAIGNSAVEGCWSLTSVLIPDGVTTIGSSAFYNCNQLNTLDIPGSVTSIGNYAFAYCPSFESVTIPPAVETLGNNVFKDCTSLEQVKLPSKFATADAMDKYFSNCPVDLEMVPIWGSWKHTGYR